MTVTIESVTGPDPVNFVYLRGSVAGIPQATETWTIACAALASGDRTIAGVRAELEAKIAQNVTNWQAAQAALQEL